MSETSSNKGKPKMTASAVLRAEAKYRWPMLEYHQNRIDRLVDWLKWGHRRVRAIYNAETGVALREHEVLKIAEIEAEQKARERQAEEATYALRTSQENYRALEARLSALEALYSRFDPEFSGQHVAAARAYAGGEVGSPVPRSEGNGPGSRSRNAGADR